MNCKQIQNLLPAWIDKELTDVDMTQISEHLNQCADCSAVRDTEIVLDAELSSLLQELPCPAASRGFADRVIPGVIHRHRHHTAGFVKGFGAAMAAGLALWVLVAVMPVSKQEITPATQEISIALHSVEKVKLAFHSVSSLDNAKITIQLPDHVALVGYKGRRTLTWRTNLNKGDNVLTLPLRAEDYSTGSIVATVEHATQIKTMVINIGVKEPGMTMERTELNFV